MPGRGISECQRNRSPQKTRKTASCRLFAIRCGITPAVCFRWKHHLQTVAGFSDQASGAAGAASGAGASSAGGAGASSAGGAGASSGGGAGASSGAAAASPAEPQPADPHPELTVVPQGEPQDVVTQGLLQETGGQAVWQTGTHDWTRTGSGAHEETHGEQVGTGSQHVTGAHVDVQELTTYPPQDDPQP